jgi:hypothetical protein
MLQRDPFDRRPVPGREIMADPRRIPRTASVN